MKIWGWIGLVVVGMIVCLFFVRVVLPSEIDDVSPGIECEEKYMDLADVYWVIPNYNDTVLDRVWCEEILNRDKTLGMHGVYHGFEEFGTSRSEGYFEEGVDSFEDCFGFEPEIFKPPQLVLAEGNRWIEYRVDVRLKWNQVFHKVYHCGDSGVLPNWVIRVF